MPNTVVFTPAISYDCLITVGTGAITIHVENVKDEAEAKVKVIQALSDVINAAA